MASDLKGQLWDLATYLRAASENVIGPLIGKMLLIVKLYWILVTTILGMGCFLLGVEIGQDEVDRIVAIIGFVST